MTRWQSNLLDVLYVAMESLPWFVTITVLTTIGERGYLDQLSRELRFRAATVGEFDDPDRALAVASTLAERAESASAGPALWVVFLAALGGFWLMRGMVQLRLGGAIGAIALVLASVFALNVLLHVTYAEDLLVWQNDGMANFIDDPQAYVASGANYEAIVERGGVVIGGATGIAMTFAGMVGVWLRFLYAGRRPVRFEHVLRSFGIGFAVMLGALVMARFNEIGSLAIWAIPYFILGLLALAVANSERAALPAEGRSRAASWGVAVSATLSLLVVVAAVFGLLAALDVASILGYVGGLIGTVVEWLLIIILTPIFWVLVPLMDLLIPDNLAERFQEMQPPENLFEPEDFAEGNEDDFLLPRWPLDVLKVLIFVALTWLSYRVGRALLARRGESQDDEFDEFRSDAGSGGPGLGGLLRGLLRRPRNNAGRWMLLRPIYGLYGRTVVDAEDRGFERMPSETSLEYSDVSGRVLDAPVFAEIAEAFDAARYGGHDADPEAVRRWSAELQSWETAHPATEELRDYLEQIRPPREPRPVDPAEEFAERVRRGREVAKRWRSGEGLAQTRDGERISEP